MLRSPETNYAKSGNFNIAYQVLGDGPPDLVYVGDWGTHVEGQWEQPSFARFLNQLASFSRLTTFDQRGTGVSDPLPFGRPPTLEESMDDLLAVLDAVGSDQVVLFSQGSGAPMCCLFAAVHPDRVAALILVNAFARLARAADHPWGIPATASERIMAELEDGWGKGGGAEIFAPSRADDDEFRRWFGRYRRLGASPRRAVEGYRVMFETDVRDVLPNITVPTLIIHRIGDRHVVVAHGRDLARRIHDAKYIELPGVDHLPWLGDSDPIIEETRSFLSGEPSILDITRVLSTIMFTDIVKSTELVAELGDTAWRRLLDDHDEMVRRQLARFQGREIEIAGDGFLAAFTGPTRAIHCGAAIRDAASSLRLNVRVGVHTGEVEPRGDRISGIAVHIAARVGAIAVPGEVLLTSTVKDLVAGSGFEFVSRGAHQLKGVPGKWLLYAVGS